MALIWNLSKIFVFFIYCVRSENIESNGSKTSARNENNSNSYSQHPPQSSKSFINNEYNDRPNSFNQPFVPESISANTYISDDQSKDQFNKKEQKTVILAIPVKLALQSSGQQNFETSLQQTVVEPSHSTYQSHIKNPYNTPKYSGNSNSNKQPPALSVSPYSSEESDQKSLLSEQFQAPLSQKIYSSLNSQYNSDADSKSYDLAQQSSDFNSNPSYSEQYKTASNLDHSFNEAKDYRSSHDSYGKNDNYRLNPREEYKAEINGGVDDFGSNKYGEAYNTHVKYDDSNEEKSLSNLRGGTKGLYDSDSKLEYDYDSIPDNEHKFEEFDNTRDRDNFHTKNFLRAVHLISNNNNNNNNRYNKNRQKYTFGNNQYLDNQWFSDNFEIIKPNGNNWAQVYDTISGNDFPSSGHKFHNKNIGSNAYWTRLSELFGDSQLKAASASVPITLKSSKIYGPSSSTSSNYEPLSLFAGFGRDYGKVSINGQLYPAPLVANHPPRKLYKPPNYEGNKFIQFGDYINTDLIKLPSRVNPMLMRPNLMSGFRAHKPLANYSPIASASSNSFLSPLPSIHSINKSFSRQLFPALYG